MKLGERIKDLRESKGMTQLDLAEKLFVSDKTVSKWEKGKSEPEIDILIKLSDMFNVSLDYLTTGNSNLSKTEAISKAELACREDNIALLDGVDLKAYDAKGKDVEAYAKQYQANHILEYLNNIEFNEYVEKEEYKKNALYYICAIPEGMEGDDNLVLLKQTDDKNTIASDCAEFEKHKKYHHFKIFRGMKHYEKCGVNYQDFGFSVLNSDGDDAMYLSIHLLDDEQSGVIGIRFYQEEDDEKNKIVRTKAYIKPSVMKEFIKELDAIELHKWETRFWGCPIYCLLYTLKKDKDDKTMLMYHKSYIAPSKSLYKRFLKAIQNVALHSLRDSWYRLFAMTLNTNYSKFYHDGVPMKTSEKIFSMIEKEMEFDGYSIVKNVSPVKK